MNSLNQPAETANNVLYAQAGGVSAVINASAAAVIETVKEHAEHFGNIYAALDGIQGVLEEDIVDLTNISHQKLDTLKHQPAAAFQSCRFDLASFENHPEQYERILEVFKTYGIGYFFYNGGNGSMITAKKVADFCSANGHHVVCIGIAKTIDNDLDLSHCSPGYGSAAKYLATSFLEAALDVASMHKSSTKFFIMETMGRNAGWLTIAIGLIKDVMPDVPLILLPAERPFNQYAFLLKVQELVKEKGYCVCAVSEGIRGPDGEYITISGIEHTEEQDYTQLGGVAQSIAHIVHDKLGYKTHCAIPDYLQRSASHLVSATDWRIAYCAGKASVKAALDGFNGVLPVVKLESNQPFKWSFENVTFEEVANLEKHVPEHFLTQDGMEITEDALFYLRPLIEGERPILFKNGLPYIPQMEFKTVPKQLAEFIAQK